jgi:hypothetical protein
MKILKWIVIISLMIASGFFIELVKVNINFNIEQGSKYPNFFELQPDQRAQALTELKNGNPYDYYHSHLSLGIMNHLSLRQLKILKWVHTVVFVLFFFFINKWMVQQVIADDRSGLWLAITYISAFSFALIIYLIGLPTSQSHLFYNVSRKMIGALQSPIPTMMNWAAWKLYQQKKDYGKNE